MTYTLTGITSLGTVSSEEQTKDSNLFQTPLPGSDSSQLIALDLFGAARTIIIKGTFAISDGTISTMIGQLDALVNGTQTTKIFHSDKSGSSYNVLVQTVRWSGGEGGVNLVEFEITMLEAR